MASQPAQVRQDAGAYETLEVDGRTFMAWRSNDSRYWNVYHWGPATAPDGVRLTFITACDSIPEAINLARGWTPPAKS